MEEEKGRWEVEIRYMEPQPDGSWREDEAKRKILEVSEEQKNEILGVAEKREEVPPEEKAEEEKPAKEVSK